MKNVVELIIYLTVKLPSSIEFLEEPDYKSKQKLPSEIT